MSNRVPAERIVTIDYANYRGERSLRRIVPERIWFGATSWHPEPQWLLEAYDVDRDAYRSFAVRDIYSFEGQSGTHVPCGPRVEGALI